jgi:hypothetical protein
LYLILEIVKKITITVGIFFAFKFGILGLVWSTVISSFISLLINTHYSSEMINYKTKSQLLDMLPIALISGFIFIIMALIVKLLITYSLILQIIISSFIGIFIYILVNYLIQSRPLLFAIKLIKERNL